MISVDLKVHCSFAALFLMSSGAHLDVPGHVPDEGDPLAWLQLPGEPVVLQVLDSRHAAAQARPDQGGFEEENTINTFTICALINDTFWGKRSLSRSSQC